MRESRSIDVSAEVRARARRAHLAPSRLQFEASRRSSVAAGMPAGDPEGYRVLRRRRVPPLMLVAVATSLTPAAVRADDMASLLQVLEESVVTGASRSAETSSDAPAVSSVITGEQLRRFGIRRLDEALNYLSLGVFAHDRLSTAEVGARGLALTRDTNSHMLVVLDGMVVNEQAGGSVFLHDIPMDLVDHIEVILGPGAVLYGAQAMLGVINIVTKSARHHDGLHATMQFGAHAPPERTGRDRDAHARRPRPRQPLCRQPGPLVSAPGLPRELDRARGSLGFQGPTDRVCAPADLVAIRWHARVRPRSPCSPWSLGRARV